MTKHVNVGIVAASSIIPVAEFDLGVAHLRDNGLDVTVHPNVLQHHFTYAGDDDARANSILEFAHDDRFDVIWMARGGYGAGRLLPLLDRLTKERGKPARKKLLIGYSDVTVLHEYVRNNWGWSTLHAPMPASLSFSRLKPEEWHAILASVRGQRAEFAWEKTTLKYLTPPPARQIEAELSGGNLSLLASMVGTPYATNAAGKILFLEDVSEKPHRIDRMMVQLAQSGALDRVAAIVLGDFTDCEDEADQCLQPLPPGEDPRSILNNLESRPKINLRKVFARSEVIDEIFIPLGKQLNIPIAVGLPVGHGPNFSPLPLGARYRLTGSGQLSMMNWDWTN